MNEHLHCPFLTNTQWEELETMGRITLTDDIMDSLLSWANGYELLQNGSQKDS